MAKDIGEAVREICLSFPETLEVSSHGSPDFRVRGKSFASYVVNHHGDGRIALWLRAPPGAQALCTEADPDRFFVPPYVGPRGWLGVHLNRGLAWTHVAELARDAYVTVAPKSLVSRLGPLVAIDPPAETMAPAEFDPMLSRRAQKVLPRLRKACLALPETSEATQFGHPVWRAGKKSFCSIHRYSGRLRMSFWVGAERQAALTLEPRYRIAPYSGHNGWIDLDVEEAVDWDEVNEIMLISYRHFALKRMLQAIGG